MGETSTATRPTTASSSNGAATTFGWRSARMPRVTQVASSTSVPAGATCSRVARAASDWLLPSGAQATGALLVTQSHIASNAPGTPYRNSGATLEPAATTTAIASPRQ